jgi:regulator of sigma E protease
MSILIIIGVIVGLSILIIGHEAGHYFAAKAFGLKVDEFGFGFPPRIKAWKKGETEYSINWLPFGGFVKINGERGEFAMMEKEADAQDKTPAAPGAQIVQPTPDPRSLYSQPAWKKSIIMLAGVFINFLFGCLFFAIVLMIGAPARVMIGGIEPNSPASQAGMMAGDILKSFTDVNTFINYVNANRGKEISIAVLRGDKEVDFTVTPRAQVPANEGALGVELEQGGTPRENPFAAVRDGVLDAGEFVWLTILNVGQIFVQGFTQASIPAGVVGPIGIYGVAKETAQIGWQYFIELLGEISISLTVVNCIPIPALDGGRFVMAIIEKIKGSPMSEKLESYMNGIAFLLIIVFLIFVSIRDVQTYIL